MSMFSLNWHPWTETGKMHHSVVNVSFGFNTCNSSLGMETSKDKNGQECHYVICEFSMSRILRNPLYSCAYYQDIPSAVHTINMFVIKTTAGVHVHLVILIQIYTYFEMQSIKLTETTNWIWRPQVEVEVVGGSMSQDHLPVAFFFPILSTLLFFASSHI